jgi:hypothetical protein
VPTTGNQNIENNPMQSNVKRDWLSRDLSRKILTLGMMTTHVVAVVTTALAPSHCWLGAIEVGQSVDLLGAGDQ